MQPIILSVVGAGGLFLLAGATRNHGWFLADQVCSVGAPLCDNPGWILIIGAALVFVATIHTIART
ncbi:MAG TPA: hypothetical protein VF467_17475 [Afipia sp.]